MEVATGSKPYQNVLCPRLKNSRCISLPMKPPMSLLLIPHLLKLLDTVLSNYTHRLIIYMYMHMYRCIPVHVLA